MYSLVVDSDQALAAFPTDEPFKAVAKRLGVSPNTLRRLWKDHYGEAAFKERGRRIQLLGAVAHGARAKGSPKAKTLVKVQCSQCDEPFQVTKGQRARAKQLVCPTCSMQGKDACPVCGLRCEGEKGLATHFRHQAEDPPHQEWLARREAAKWEGLTEGLDYVTCRVCGFRGAALNGHLRTHGLTAINYRDRYPEAPLRSRALYLSRSEKAVQFRYDFTPADLLKHADSKGCVVVEEVCQAHQCRGSTVIAYCRKYGIPTRNRLAWQKVVLDQAARYLGEDYIWEWSHPSIVNPETGWKFNFDGFFPQRRLIIEAHGEQHFRYSEKWHGTVEEFEKQRSRDALKCELAEKHGFQVKVVRHTDNVHSPDFWAALLSGDPSQWVNLEEAQKEDAVEVEFLKLRCGGWPRLTPSQRSKAELTNLRKVGVHLDEARHITPYSVVGTTACATFFPNRYYARYKEAKSAYEAWHDDDALRKAIRLQLDSGHPTTPERVLRALVMHHRTPSVFRPAVAKYVYQTYAPGGVVWDPCAGYGGRLMGALAAGVERYVATDVEPETVEGNQALAQALGLPDRCSIHLERAERFDPGPVDLVFTSPPYLDLEIYGSAPRPSPSRWVSEFLAPVVRRAAQRLREGGHLVLNLPFKPVRGLRLDLEAKTLAAGEGLVEEPSLWMPVRTFRGPFKAEPLLVWRR